MQLPRTFERGQGERHAGQRAAGALGGLVGLPGHGLRRRVGNDGVAEHVGMAPNHLVAQRVDHGVEAEPAGFLGQARVKHHLEQQVAELGDQIGPVGAPDGVGDLVGFLDGVRRDRGEGLLTVPRTTGCRIAQTRHDPEQAGDVAAGHGRLSVSLMRYIA